MEVLHKPKTRKLHILQNELDKIVDERVKGTGLKASCKSGCGACCHQWVGVMWLEAMDALDEAKRVGYEIDTIDLSRQVRKSFEPGMTQQKWFGTKCIFLTTRSTCAIYKRRPMSCRGTVVASDPVLCGMSQGEVTKFDTRKEMQAALLNLKVEHFKEGVSDVVGPLPLMVDLVLRGKKPQDIATKARLKTGVIGLDLPVSSSDDAPDETASA